MTWQALSIRPYHVWPHVQLTQEPFRGLNHLTLPRHHLTHGLTHAYGQLAQTATSRHVKSSHTMPRHATGWHFAQETEVQETSWMMC